MFGQTFILNNFVTESHFFLLKMNKLEVSYSNSHPSFILTQLLIKTDLAKHFEKKISPTQQSPQKQKNKSTLLKKKINFNKPVITTTLFVL